MAWLFILTEVLNLHLFSDDDSSNITELNFENSRPCIFNVLALLNMFLPCLVCFCEILVSTYGPGCSRTIFKKHTAPGAYSKHAPGAVCISNMVLQHIWLRKFFQIMNSPGPQDLNGPGPYGPASMVLDRKSRP